MLCFTVSCTDRKPTNFFITQKVIVAIYENWALQGNNFLLKLFTRIISVGDSNSDFEFIWIQYICKFCLVYHLIDLDATR